MTMLSDPTRKYRAFPRIGLRDRRWPDAEITHPPIWCSVDLRDGNQALIEPMDTARKRRMFDTLVGIGFTEIEVGFPSASQTEFDFVRSLIEEDAIPEQVTIQVLTQAREDLIRRTFAALEGAPRAIVHFYHATAPVMRRVVFGMSEEQVIADLAVRHATLIRDLAAERPGTRWTFQYSPEMFSDTELDFSRRIVDAVTAVWAPTPDAKCIINLPSTVEHSSPNVFADMVEWMDRNIARRDAVVLSVHPHNDRGTGTASAELAVMAGADRLEGCLFGNGERTGNLDLVNVALNLYTQGVHPGLDLSDIDGIRTTVEHCNQLPVHPRHPYVGDLVYTSFSGSHQDAIRKALAARKDGDDWDVPYLPIDPMDLGRSYQAIIRVNSQSGKGGITYLLESEYGLSMPRRMQIEFAQTVQRVMDEAGTEMSPTDLWTLFEKTYLDERGRYRDLSYRLVEDTRANSVRIEAEVTVDGVTHTILGTGGGPVEAFVDVLTGLCDAPITVVDYHEHALGDGSDARAASYVEVRVGDGPPCFGVGIDPSIVTASLAAVLGAVNRHHERMAGDSLAA